MPASPPPRRAPGLTTTPSSPASSRPPRGATGLRPDGPDRPEPGPPMLRIRTISDSHTPANRSALEESQAIITAQFPGMPAEKVARLADQLDNPLKYRFVARLLVAEDARARVNAAALLLHDPDLAFSYLEVISIAPGGRSGSGLGGALYDRVREEAEELGSTGLYFECLPDDEAKSPDPKV